MTDETMLQNSVDGVVKSSIPVIDLQDLLSKFEDNDYSKKEEKSSVERIAKELVQAFQGTGFATLIHHGIDESVIAAAFEASKSFFEMSTERKLESKYLSHESNRGYIPVGTEKHESVRYDCKETFDIGKEGEAGCPETPWPASDSCVMDGFKEILLTYWKQMNQLHLTIMRLLAIGLDVSDTEFFVNRCNQEHCNLRLLHYPALTVPSGNEVLVRGARHTDFGTITLLTQDGVGGLRVQLRGSTDWTYVPPIPNAVVVNVGDMLARWTNGMLQATPHQVVSVIPADAETKDETSIVIPERYSIAFFCNANKDVLLDSRDLFPDTAPQYPPINAHEYLTQRLAATIHT